MTAPDFPALLSSASVEVSSRGHQLQELRDNVQPGTDVTITFLPGDNYRHNVDTATALRRATHCGSRSSWLIEGAGDSTGQLPSPTYS